MATWWTRSRFAILPAEKARVPRHSWSPRVGLMFVQG